MDVEAPGSRSGNA